MTSLFHYTSINTLKKILENNTLKFNNINKVNDPHESKSFNISDINEELMNRFYISLEYYNILLSLEKEIEILDEEIDIKKIEYEEALYYNEIEKAKYKKSEYYELEQKEIILKNKYTGHLRSKSSYSIKKFSNDNKYYIRIPDSFDQFNINNKFVYKHYNKLKNSIVKTACFCTGVFNVDKFHKDNIQNKRQGFFYPRMWAQYANKSSGCCIIFKKNVFKKLFDKLSDKYYTFDDRIKYIDILNIEHIYNLQKLISFINKIKNNYDVINFLIRNYHLLFFRKDKDWADEKEHRYLIIDKSGNNKSPYFMEIENAMNSIILGENFKSDISDIMEKCKEKGIKLYKINNYLGKYYLDNIEL
jgi:hypothetical protein